MEIPDTRRLLHAYGLATDAPAHLEALTGTDGDAIAKASYYLYSAIIHQGTPWPATGPVVAYVCSLVERDALSVTAGPAVLGFLDEVLDAVELGKAEGGVEWLQAQVAASPFDLDSAMEELRQLSEEEVEDAIEALFGEDDFANLVMYSAFLGILDQEPAIRAAREVLTESSQSIVGTDEPTVDEVLARAGGSAGGPLPLTDSVSALRVDRARH